MNPTAPATLDEVIALCRRLRLRYVREQAPDVLLTAKAQRWDPAEVLRVLLTAEAEGRDRSTIEHHRRKARFPTGKTFHTWQPDRSSIPAASQAALRTLEWVDRAENLVVCGPSGTGKSHFCEALGHTAIEAGRTVRWFSVEDLGALVRRHRIDDSIAKAFTPILRAQLVIIDDIGLLPISADAAEGLYRLIDAAYERRSLAISSNLHPSGLDQLIEPGIAGALVDRLLHTPTCSSPKATASAAPTPPPETGSHHYPPDRGPTWPPAGKSHDRARGEPTAANGENQMTVDNITAAHARRLVSLNGPRTAVAYRDGEEVLVGRARTMRWADFGRACAYWQRQARDHGPDPDKADRDHRHVSVHDGLRGTGLLTGELTPL